jgi:hypothetical protein
MHHVIGAALARADAEFGGDAQPAPRRGATALPVRNIWETQQPEDRPMLEQRPMNPVATTPDSTPRWRGEPSADALAAFAGRLCSVRRGDGSLVAANAMLHRNGNLYGDAAARRATRWRFERPGMVFTDAAGRNRLAWRDTGGEARGVLFQHAPPIASGRYRRAMVQVAARTATLRPECTDLRLAPQRPPAGGKRRFECVVARFREDTAWTDCLAGYTTIYRKAPEDTGDNRLPNIGREAGTYLHHIAANYDRLADRTLFLQGDPFPHHLLPLERYIWDENDFIADAQNLLTRGFQPSWSAPGQPLTRAAMRDFLELIECDPDPEAVRWTFGAQFCCSRELIHRRPRRYYQKLFDLSQRRATILDGVPHGDHSIGFLFEFFWQLVFRVPQLRAAK